MKQITLNSKLRENTGRRASRLLRESGEIPAVLYGESGIKHLTINTREFHSTHRSLIGSAALIELYVEGQDDSTYAVLQELQRNPRNDRFIHIDFREIVRGKEMEANIPVHAMGTPDGVRNYGGVLEISAEVLRVRCRPRHLPEHITVDVTDLEIGKSIHLSEIEAPEGVTFLDDPDWVVASCVGASSGSSGVELEEEAEEGEESTEEEAAEETEAADKAETESN